MPLVPSTSLTIPFCAHLVMPTALSLARNWHLFSGDRHNYKARSSIARAFVRVATPCLEGYVTTSDEELWLDHLAAIPYRIWANTNSAKSPLSLMYVKEMGVWLDIPRTHTSSSNLLSEAVPRGERPSAYVRLWDSCCIAPAPTLTLWFSVITMCSHDENLHTSPRNLTHIKRLWKSVLRAPEYPRLGCFDHVWSSWSLIEQTLCSYGILFLYFLPCPLIPQFLRLWPKLISIPNLVSSWNKQTNKQTREVSS